MTKAAMEIEAYGLKITGDVYFGETEGDPSIPGGTHELGPSTDDIEVETDDGTLITDWLTDEAIQGFGDLLIEMALEAEHGES